MNNVITMTLSTLFINIISTKNKNNNFILEFIDYYDEKNKDIFKINLPYVGMIKPNMTNPNIRNYTINEFKDQMQFGNIVRESNMIGNIIFNKLAVCSSEFTHKLDEKYKNLEDYDNIKFIIKYIDNYDYISILNKELRERCNIIE